MEDNRRGRNTQHLGYRLYELNASVQFIPPEGRKADRRASTGVLAALSRTVNFEASPIERTDSASMAPR
jgi:hypothetical protein